MNCIVNYFWIFAFIAGLSSVSLNASAETWVANCNGIQLNANLTTRRAIIYVHADAGQGAILTQISNGEVTNSSALTVTLRMTGGVPNLTDEQLASLTLNRELNVVFANIYQPATRRVVSQRFCQTPIRINP